MPSAAFRGITMRKLAPLLPQKSAWTPAGPRPNRRGNRTPLIGTRSKSASSSHPVRQESREPRKSHPHSGRVPALIAALLIAAAGCGPKAPLYPLTLDSQTLTEAQFLARQRTQILNDIRLKAKRDIERKRKELIAANKKTGQAITLSAGDEFVVDVWLHDGISELQGFPYKGTVRPDGKEFIPGVGEVICLGKTVDQIRKAITSKLKLTLNKPLVLIRVTRHIGATVTIVGEVKMHPNRDTGPGVYPIKGATPLSSFIMAAGGYTDKADLHNIRVVYADGTVEIVDLERILAGDMRKNIILHGGETVYLPEQKKTGSVLVMGHVRRPAIYGLTGDNRLSRIIAEAGGILPSGSRKRIYVIRGDLYKPQVMEVDLDHVIRYGLKEEDVRLANGDTVYVPMTHIAALREFLSLIWMPISTIRDVKSLGQ